MVAFATVRTRIEDELNRTDLTTFITREINTAIAHYEPTRARFNEIRDWLIAVTVPGTRYYSLTSNFLSFDSVWIIFSNARIPLTHRTHEFIQEVDRQDTAIQGLPVDYSIYANELRLYPTANGSYSMFGSYLRSYARASTSGSLTTSDSVDLANGWLDEGEELIRLRAKRAIEIHYLKNEAAIAEAAGLAIQGDPFLSFPEKNAFIQFRRRVDSAVATGRIKPYEI